MKDQLMRFLQENESSIRRWDALILLVGLTVIFGLRPAGWVEQCLRIITGLAAFLMYAFFVLDEQRKARQHPRSMRVQTVEKYVALGLWLLIGLFLLVAFIAFLVM